MDQRLKEDLVRIFGTPVNSPRECEKLSETIRSQTGRKVSSTTLRRYFGLLPSRSSFSTYVLDTLAIYCGSKDYQSYCKKRGAFQDYAEQQRAEVIHEVNQFTEFTLSSIERKSLGHFNITIPRERINGDLDNFLDSSFLIHPVIAPDGFGKSVALAHWVKERSRHYHCLFCTAVSFHSLLSPAGRSGNPLHLDIASWSNVFNVFLNDIKLREAKFLLVIDGLDDLSQNEGRLNSVLEYIFEVVHRFGYQKKIKVIVSCSSSVWYSLLSDTFEKIKEKNWYAHSAEMLNPGYRNIPVFSNSEIRKLIALGNGDGGNAVFYECIPWNIRDMMKIPISFHFVSSLYRRRTSLDMVHQIEVIREFMEEMVFQTRYSEQKEDLIWKIIEMLNDNKNCDSVRKSVLKKHYPVHLKRETGYYHAYDDLLKNGILSEFRKENRFGIRELHVEFNHKNLYFYLYALFLAHRNGRLDMTLFRDLSAWPMSISWRASILAVLFQVAYENENFSALKEFCKLPDELLDSMEVRLSVGACFRKSNAITDRLIEAYASDENGRIYFFERFVDINHLFHNYAFRIEAYMKYETTEQGRLFGHTILYLADLLSLDREKCISRYSYIAGWNVYSVIHPWPLGRRLAAMILHHCFVDENRTCDLEGLIRKNAETAHQYPGYLEKGVIEFEQYVMIALVLVQEYVIMEKLLAEMVEKYESSENEASPLQKNQNALPEHFLLYARYKLGKAGTNETARIWVDAIDNYTATFDDYQFLILLHWFLVDYHFSEGEEELGMEFYGAALELSKLARYDLYTAWLLRNDPGRDPGRLNEGEEMIRRSGMNACTFSFRFGTSREPSALTGVSS